MAATANREDWALSGALAEFAADREFDLVREIIDLFVADTEEKLESLRKAVLAADLIAAQRIGHSLKGVARQMGAMCLADEAERLEHSPAELDPGAFSSSVQAIVERWHETKQSVVNTRNALPPGVNAGSGY